MKKYFSTNEYKKLNLKRSTKAIFKRSKNKPHKSRIRKREVIHPQKNNKVIPQSYFTKTKNKVFKPPVAAPNDLRLFDQLENCLLFFNNLRDEENKSKTLKASFVSMSLKYVTQIDYATISILTAINDLFKYNNIMLRTILPENIECKNFMIESGYLNNLVDNHGKPFSKMPGSELIFFEKGSGLLSLNDNIKISKTVKNIVNHLCGNHLYFLPIKTIILEICGNSIEWSGTGAKQWLLGVKYENDRVTLTVTDVGKGILATLFRRFSKKFFDKFRSRDEILLGAFNQKYGSTTQEVNRNKGLPSIKANFENGLIKNLKVLSNDVILDFENPTNSRAIVKSVPAFRGTFYQWEMDLDCLKRYSFN